VKYTLQIGLLLVRGREPAKTLGKIGSLCLEKLFRSGIGAGIRRMPKRGGLQCDTDHFHRNPFVLKEQGERSTGPKGTAKKVDPYVRRETVKVVVLGVKLMGGTVRFERAL